MIFSVRMCGSNRVVRIRPDRLRSDRNRCSDGNSGTRRTSRRRRRCRGITVSIVSYSVGSGACNRGSASRVIAGFSCRNFIIVRFQSGLIYERRNFIFVIRANVRRNTLSGFVLVSSLIGRRGCSVTLYCFGDKIGGGRCSALFINNLWSWNIGGRTIG